MKYRIGSILLLCFLLFQLNNSFAQDGQYIEVRDFESWTSGQVKYKFNDKITFGLEGQLRLDRNSSEIKNYLTEFETKYKLTKKFEVGLGLRFINKNDNEGDVQGYEQHFRYHLDASFKHKIDRFNFKYRFRYQNKNEIGISSTEGDVAVQNFRFKTSVGYNIRKWKFDPELSAEIFNKYEKYGQSNGFDTYRITAGTSYKFKNAGKIGLYYRMDQEISSFYPKTSNIILLNYTYTFKR